VPWPALEALIEPYHPKVGPQGGRRPFRIAVMLRIYCLHQWYCLSDPGAEEALYDIQSMRAFCHLALGRDTIPRGADGRFGCEPVPLLLITCSAKVFF
jgi:IS5 family transposase